MPEEEKFSPEGFMGVDAPPAEPAEGELPIETPPVDTPPVETPPADTPPADTPPPSQEPTPDEVQFDEYWGALKEEVGDFDEDIVKLFKEGKDAEGNPLDAKTKLNLLKDFMIDNVMFGGTPEHDSFIRDYMVAAQQEGFNRKDWLQRNLESAGFMELPAKDFLKTYYKRYSESNKLNWSDDDIDGKVNSMSVIDADMQASQLKAQYHDHLSRQQQTQTQDNLKKYEQQIKDNLAQTNNSIKADLQSFIAEAQGKKTLGGFEFGDADKKAFLEALPAFVEKKVVDLGNGQRIIASDADMVLEEIKAKPEASLNMLPYLYLIKQGKIDGYMSRIIEGKKKQIEETLDDTPESQFNRGNIGTPGFDPGSFMKAGG